MTIIKIDDGKGKKKYLWKQSFHDIPEWTKLIKDMRIMTRMHHMSMDAIELTLFLLFLHGKAFIAKSSIRKTLPLEFYYCYDAVEGMFSKHVTN